MGEGSGHQRQCYNCEKVSIWQMRALRNIKLQQKQTKRKREKLYSYKLLTSLIVIQPYNLFYMGNKIPHNICSVQSRIIFFQSYEETLYIFCSTELAIPLFISCLLLLLLLLFFLLLLLNKKMLLFPLVLLNISLL